MNYEGADYIEQTLKIQMSPLGRTVADLLGQWAAGLYHLTTCSLKKVKWSDTDMIRITVPPTLLATVDPCGLTVLVVLCHDRCVRMEIRGKSSWGFVELRFWQRKREGGFSERHPTIEAAIKDIREALA
jgi:hypothetical protein